MPASGRERRWPVRLEGKAGVVTGTSKGLGREILFALCREGARIVALSRNPELGQAGVEEAVRAGGTAVFEQGDVTREEDVVRAIERCREEFGTLDLMVNNAGILGEGRLHETTNEQWDELVAVHMTGTFWGCKHAIAAMRETGRRRHRQRRLDPVLHGRRLPRRLHRDEGGDARADEGDRHRLRGGRHPLQLRLPRGHGDADDRAVLRRDRRPAAARAEMEAAYPGSGSRTRGRWRPRSSSSARTRRRSSAERRSSWTAR